MPGVGLGDPKMSIMQHDASPLDREASRTSGGNYKPRMDHLMSTGCISRYAVLRHVDATQSKQKRHANKTSGCQSKKHIGEKPELAMRHSKTNIFLNKTL